MKTEPDVERLAQFFDGFQCHGVVALIEYLASPEAKGLTEIGSSSIGLGKIMNEIFLSEEARMASAWFRTKSLYIGSNNGEVTPLQWLEKLLEVFEKVSPQARKEFDELCREFAFFSQLKPVGQVIISKRGGMFSVPAEAWKKDMTEEELEIFRVPHGNLDTLLSDKWQSRPSLPKVNNPIDRVLD